MKRFWRPSKEHLGEFKSLQSAMVEAETSSWQPGRQRGSERFPRRLFLVGGAVAAALMFGLGFWCGQVFTASGRPPIAQRPTQIPNEMALRQASKQQGMEGKPLSARPTSAGRPAMQPARSAAPARRPLMVQPD